MPYVMLGIRCLLGCVFLMSFLTKISGRASFARFVDSVRDMRLLPHPLSRPAALAVVVAEGTVCLLLAAPAAPATVAGFCLAAGLLAAFTTGIALALRRGVRTSCRCFGASDTLLGGLHIGRNAALIACSALGAVTVRTDGTTQAAGSVLAVCTGLLLGGLVIKLDDLSELFRPVHSHPSGKPSGAARGL
ncbi:MauE/DoxX family redox-associated membrane protein [Streptomyces violaceusniger]|uniref:Methylamine utilization protein MauE n=1 Tax=Streptomyces violaceusniger TaxID=68280 RepID=A0A4D4LBL0_STRVO|nr:methylamine utilization protein MauE [Streptomyces violaceusniger]